MDGSHLVFLFNISINPGGQMTWGTVMLMIEGKTLRENLIQELTKK